MVNQMNSKELDEYFGEWNLQLQESVDEMLDTKFRLKYPFETMEKFDCMVDEVNRLDKVIKFHDILAQVSENRMLEIVNHTGDRLEDILLEFLDYYMNVPLEIKLDKKKIIENFIKILYSDDDEKK